MAITRGQMQRQLRRGGGIMNIAPREQFGLGSKLKRAVRKIIPNEVSKIAVKAAPFVAPFNPQLAAAMAGIGSFDQTGSIGDSLKSAAITYGGGQLARYAGGAGFQQPGMGNFGLSGFSSPIGTSTGFGKMFGAPKTTVKGVQPLDYSDMSQFNKLGLGGSNPAGIAGARPDLTLATGDGAAMEAVFKNVTPNVSDAATKTITKAATESAPKSVIQAIKNQDYFEAAKLAAEKGTKALFTNKDGSLDKNMILAAGTAGLSYIDAKKLADEMGEDIGTEEEYDEATKDEFKAKYAGYLTNFFEGKKDGGRIGFDEGANTKFAMIKDMLAKGMDAETIMSIAGATQEEINSVKNKRVEEAQGGRIELRDGSSTGSFGLDRYLSEMLEETPAMFTEGEDFISKYEDMVKKQKIDSRAFDMMKELKNLEKKADYIQDKFKNEGILDTAEESLDEDALKFYDKKSKDLEKQEDALTKREDDAFKLEKASKFDVSEITKSPDYQNWLRLYKSKNREDRKKAFDDPNADIYSGILGLTLKGRKESFDDLVGFAQGGRIGYMFGDRVEDDEGIMSMSKDKEDENMKMAYFPGDVFSREEIRRLFSDKSLTTNQDRKNLYRILMNPGMFPEAEQMLIKMLRGNKDGGRIGYGSGSRPSQLFKLLEEAEAAGDMDKVKEIKSDLFREFGLKLAKGGRINYNMGSEVPVRKNKAGIEELDYRESGGFVPVGVKEKADDVPAMLSKNEFVLTADAVRGIGGGDVEKGAEKLYGVMKQAEKVGRA